MYYPPEFVSYFKNNFDQINERLYYEAASQNQKLQIECANYEDSEVEILNINIEDPVTFNNSSEHPLSGFWSIHYNVYNCGASSPYNAVFIANDGKPTTVYSTIMGNSKSPFILIVGTFNGILNSYSKVFFCNSDDDFFYSFIVYDSMVVTEDGDSWYEIWNIRACDNDVDLMIKFRGDDNGKYYYHFLEQ